ncbi:peptidase M15 [uncultured Mediterranean phage uvMED]|jgi:zinc D-Ala-D-Ala carboxypeptidase|nr:peptidase M15 [uncultured Mediterranean phage uvMED]
MQLSKHFSLKEMTKSATAARLGLDNTPNEEQIENLKALCENILEPLRDYYESRPIMVSSGFRSEKLSEAIGSSSRSAHCQGMAVDFEIPGFDNKQVAAHIKNNFDFDQLISEYYEEGVADSGWIHVAYKRDGSNRKQSLIKDKEGYKEWQ